MDWAFSPAYQLRASTAELVTVLSQFQREAQNGTSGPMFGGLFYDESIAKEERGWRCLFYENSSIDFGTTLRDAGLDPETWTCAEMFASVLWHCTERIGQKALCPNWLWGRRQDIFGSQPGQPRANVETMRSLIGLAPMCVVQDGGWAKSRLVQIWKMARDRQDEERQIEEQDLITMKAVKDELCQWSIAHSM
ncbi:hypothetical protein CFIO01_02303 [Colletotrichum fioriniae PJ7]|uniref:Uncharacterized protein n=1 Tax=Colletotrichum fioriniae PJ7 TaxID=1445577 RepID=A0A010S649_9PEZI|nr:hypothetical protein CFIO01_02303 [Colletotrichum fioriniae PJ7]